MLPNTTSTPGSSSTHNECPFALIVLRSQLSKRVTRILPRWKLRQEKAERERVRLHYVEVFSSSPLYQALAEKDPNYWNRFDSGIVHM
jgi:hypothetical protein